jgi:hypothetical protein
MLVGFSRRHCVSSITARSRAWVCPSSLTLPPSLHEVAHGFASGGPILVPTHVSWIFSSSLRLLHHYTESCVGLPVVVNTSSVIARSSAWICLRRPNLAPTHVSWIFSSSLHRVVRRLPPFVITEAQALVRFISCIVSPRTCNPARGNLCVHDRERISWA